MALQEDFNQIIDYAHFWNWAPDWGEVQRILELQPPTMDFLYSIVMGNQLRSMLA